MKFRAVCIAILFMMTLSACHEVKSNDTNKNINSSAIISSCSWEKHGHQPLMSTVVSQPLLSANEGMTIDVPEAGLNSVVVRKKTEAHTTNFSQYPLYAYILSDYRYSQPAIHDTYLAVETGSKILFYDLGNSSLDDVLFTNDVDGDGLDEIIVQQTVDETGGAGQFSSSIFKVRSDQIHELFNSSTSNLFETGFSSTLEDGFKLKVENRFTGYSATLDFNADWRYVGTYFDESGKVIWSEPIMCDSFREFVPEDTDGDGIYEIACLQYVSLYGHSDYVGDAKSILRFNVQAQQFEVAEASFIPAL